MNRRRVLEGIGLAGAGAAVARGIAGRRILPRPRTEIVYAMARPDPGSHGLEPRTKEVPAKWHENLQLGFELQEQLRSMDLPSLHGAFVVPGSFDDPEASIAVDVGGEDATDPLDDVPEGVTIDLNVVQGLPPDGDDEPTVAESHQVADLDRRAVPGGVACVTESSVGTLAPALYAADGRRRFFATSNHMFAAAGSAGGTVALLHGGEERRIGRRDAGYPPVDVARIRPMDGYRPTSEIARGSPGTVIGQYTKLGLADLKARGEPLRKLGAFSDRSVGEVKGIDGVTCFTGQVCRRGQLKWGDEEAMVDGDSGSVNFHRDPEHPDEYVLVGGINNARTWWPGAEFTWGTAAYHLREAYGLHF